MSSILLATFLRLGACFGRLSASPMLGRASSITLQGYFGHGSLWGESNASFLVLVYRILTSKSSLVYGTWVRLNGNVPSVDYEGSLIQVEGIVKSYNQVYGNVSSYDVPLIMVENYYIIVKANTTLKSIKPSIPISKAPLF